MSLEANRTTARRYFEDIFNRGELDLADELSDLDHQLNSAYVSETRGPNPMKGVVWVFHKMLPDLEAIVEDEIVDGDKVVIRWTLKGTPADKLRTTDGNETLTVSGISISHVIGGKIKETWLQFEADLGESQRPTPKDEFRTWLLEDTSTVEETRLVGRFDLEEDCPECFRICCLLRICC